MEKIKAVLYSASRPSDEQFARFERFLAKKYGVIIVEDNPYGEIRFEGETIPNIKSFDTDGLVVYAGSFSKVLAPGLRLGYAIAPKELLSKIIVCKQVAEDKIRSGKKSGKNLEILSKHRDFSGKSLDETFKNG